MCTPCDNFITPDQVINLRCDKENFTSKMQVQIQKSWMRPRFMFVFENGDLNTAAHCLAENMHEPFEPYPIASVAVQQSVRDEFIERVKYRFHQLPPHVATHPNFERSLKELQVGGIKYEVADIENAPPVASPIIVTDNITHLHFSTTPTGVVTLKSFETISQAADIIVREQPPFDVIHIFDESIVTVYSLASRITGTQFYVNCMEVCLLPILPFYSSKQACTKLYDGYHFETLELGAHWRIIVFPYHTTYTNRCCCPLDECYCTQNNHHCCE
ncbi:uncharacterized protein LOC6574272 [Drosophila mojavensis]|uniref:Uncharacterized protein n=1 Tax=Drosophila mojavensis TaxID=7230 RepID=B4KB84_DROMO|nr:uncharacterized protein LOC6574272 [Drosophila mojavensis]EDW15788.1 uncharacterized protein Dmoj_GI22587 [Drosophila mojavensis]